EEHITHLPVIEDGRLVGICTRTDILAARLGQFQREHLQPGWPPLTTIASWPQALGRRVGHRLANNRPGAVDKPRKEDPSMRNHPVGANEAWGRDPLPQVVGKCRGEGPCHFHIVVPAPAPTTLFGSALAAYEGDQPGDAFSLAAAHEGLRLELQR